MTIRSHLLLLALAAVLPVLSFALFASILLVQHDRETQRAGALDRARAMLTAVDTELRGSVATLQAMSASRSLRRDDLPGFRDAAGRVLATQPTWLNVALSLPSGKQVLNLAAPADAELGAAADPENLERVVRQKAPSIGYVVTDNLLHAPAIPVRVPVVREEQVVYVLTALVRPEAFAELISQQHLPEGWVSGVVDGKRRFVARIPRKEPGELSSENFRAALQRGGEGWYRGRTVEGADTFTAYKTSSFSGWSIGLAVPTATVDAGAQRSAWLTAVGVLLSMGLAFAGIVIIGRRIAAPIRSLAYGAHSVGGGGELRLQAPERVREVAEVAAALREAAAAVRERQQLLEREKEALEAADKAKNEFLAMLSHELRNPLAAMNSAAHLLKAVDPGHPAAPRARDVIERQTRLMTRLIEDLLDVTRITMGKASLERRPLDLAEVVSAVVESWRGSGRLSGHAVAVHASPVWVNGDRARLEQILSNLLDNALKFTPAGRKIEVSVRRADGAAVLSVQDQGDGIAPELLERAFDLFVQGQHGIDRGKGGMGIGLAMVKRLAEMHGGAAAISSGGPGQGTTVTVQLPALERAAAQPAPPAAPAGGSRRILIIEDNDDAREMLRESLSLSGHEVRDARDGKSGLALAAQSAPEVALIDIGLPDMDGYEVARRLRSSLDGGVVLVALTGYGQVEDVRRSAEAGFDAHLTKPVDSDRLLATIAGLAFARPPGPQPEPR
ncbi:MAG TPA: ATP-binding protein [Myxococcales bacterium]|nr:ATP-binding protein [Myxococcales bacterium]